VNFMLHFHFAAGESGSDAVGFGAMLPDLWRMAAKAARARRGLDASPANPIVRDVLVGIEHHFDADAWFHRSATFDAYEKRTADALLRADGGESPRLRLFAHVASEMALDGALLRRNADLEARVRHAIEEARDAGREAAELHHADARARAGDAAARYEDRIERIVSAVASYELPRGYAIPEGLATRLAGVRSGFGMLASREIVARWASAFSELEPEMDAALEELISLRAARA